MYETLTNHTGVPLIWETDLLAVSINTTRAELHSPRLKGGAKVL